jgi:hypothetical protein
VHDATSRRPLPTPCPSWCAATLDEPHAEHWCIFDENGTGTVTLCADGVDELGVQFRLDVLLAGIPEGTDPERGDQT